jgi:hypothetical protein
MSKSKIMYGAFVSHISDPVVSANAGRKNIGSKRRR